MRKLLILLIPSFIFARILIQGAMPIEIDTLVNAMSDKKVVKIGSYIFYEGKIKGRDIVVSRTLIGLVNASAATTLGITYFKPDIIINQGTAGAIVEGLKLGDIVVGDRIYNANSYKTPKSLYTINPLAKEPMIAPLTLLDANNEDLKNEYFTSNETLVNKFISLAPKGVLKVNIASADAFNKEILMLHLWNKTYNASVEEMESVAAAQVAKAFNVPFLAIRIVSDNLIEDIDYTPSIATKLQELLIKIIDKF
ncbi:5'-methylthioadenosine/S-adenosylhomocysteine nucleosidase [Campylobacter sp. 2018MI13]|uniref:5'-methylthioadenosine/S-adenosylhomocysteine nucleosidase n=1 Tax=Campylobacter sp. 2018MI13 TaxID=2836737 RepID=UPI001BDA49D9|nr:5'-methylthioadenosine/S-adenosylhomocysteine nucleosidase [Campylobacter sp. 2018MI13]MBT0882006.1 5'-methylthioadenosine/S-adenosylhomocysteine nucleosidase [Campylobacter sp. 2018MI13]